MDPIQLIAQAVAFNWGLLIKYHPKFKPWPNAAIPYLTVIVGMATAMAQAGNAAAAGEPIAGGTTLAVLGFIPAIHLPTGGFFGAIAQGVWMAVQNFIAYEVFTRHPLEKGAGLKKM